MDTKAFLKHVLPKQGLKILAVPSSYVRDGKTLQGWKYTTYESIGMMAEAAQQFDEAGKSVYFAVNGFGDWYEGLDKRTGKPKRMLRTQENVVACRSLFEDFDVDPNKPTAYATRKEAMDDIVRLAKELRLTPTIVSSGGGFHCYFTADEDMSPAEWLELAATKRDITAHLAIKGDHAVDTDLARVLRPIGVHNRKTDTPRPVELMKAGKVYAVAKLKDTFSAYAEANGVMPVVTTTRGGTKMANPFAVAVPEYPPSSAYTIIKHCQVLAEVAETAGNGITEPVWRGALSVVAQTIEGPELAHEWSKGDPRYDPAETQSKIDNWTMGPATCEYFNLHAQCKETCAKAVKSPIQLGYLDAAPSVEVAPVITAPSEQPAGQTVAGRFIPYWPEGYRWDGAYLSVRRRVDDEVQWVPILRTVLHVINRVRQEDGTWALVIGALERNGDWREFTMATSDLSALDTMSKSLAQHEVFPVQNKYAKPAIQEMLAAYTENLQMARMGTTTVRRFGWTDDFSGFVIGTNIIKRDGTTRTVLPGEAIPWNWRVDFGAKGAVDEWVKAAEFWYNRPGAEVMQFALLHGLGAPLVKLFNSSSWHGLPMALVGAGGKGKTMIAQLACAPYGNPSHLMFDATKNGATVPAIIAMTAAMSNLPLLIDEVSGRTVDEVSGIAYALANGRDKIRLNSSGAVISNKGEWFTNSFITSNNSIHDILSKVKHSDVYEATALRVFEVSVPTNFIDAVFPDTDKTMVEGFRDGQHGFVGPAFLHYVMNHRDVVQGLIERVRAKFSRATYGESTERFYLDAIANAVITGKIAERMGLISFDVMATAKWALREMVKLRDSRSSMRTSADDVVARFVASLHGRMIVTKHLGDGRRHVIEPLVEQLKFEPVGRCAIEDGKAFVSTSYVNTWCKENDVPVALLKNRMDETGLIKLQADGQPSKVMRISSGTPVPSATTRVYELNFNALYGSGAALSIVPTKGEAIAHVQ